MKRVFTSFGFKSLFLLTTVFILTQTSFATTAVRPSDDDLNIGARAIVRGKVVSIESAIGETNNQIYTYITVKVQEVIKGQITERRIVLKEMGGRAGDRISVIYGNPQFKRGERVFLYLDTWADGSLRTYQMFLGKFSIIEENGNQYVYRDMSSDSVVLVPNPNGEPQGPSTDRMELSAYTDMVRSRQVANLEAARAFEEKYYGGVLLRSQPPEFKRISSVSGFLPEFTFLGNARWFEPDTNQPVTYTVNPVASSGTGFPPLAVPESDVAAAANAWSVVPGCALRISYAGQLTQCYTSSGTPGINVVSNNCDGRNAPSQTCAGILAWGGYSGGTSETKNINGTNFQRITQGFISFNPYATCYFGNSCNVQEITTHELGHALGLGHSADSTATMYGYAHFDGRCASIKTDDANGIKFIYPGSGGGPGPLSIATTSLAPGVVTASYNQALVANGGTPNYTWSLVAGQGLLPAGLTLSAGGVVSGTPTVPGTSNFTVKVTDSAQATAQKPLSIVVTAGGAALDSQFVSQTMPTSLQPGQGFSVNLKFLNTGTQTWSGSAYWLVSQNPPLNQTWGGNGVPLTSYSIAPGQQLDLTFTAYAPATPGTYNFQWQVYQNGGVGFFGQPSANVAIQVGSAPTPTDNAAFASQTVPATMTAGAIYPASVTMTNTGTTTWAAGTYYLGSQNPQSNNTWGLNRVNLTSPVAPGGQANFTFNVTAPSTPGTYNFQWQMAKDGGGYFGARSASVVVTVSNAARKAAFDFDGDGKTDTVVYRKSTGYWLIVDSSTGQYRSQWWGYESAGDVPVPGDYDGDGKTDIAVFRKSTSDWFIINSSTGQYRTQSWGSDALGDMPVPGDYDGDGKTDIAVYRRSTGYWLILNSSTGQYKSQWWGYESAGDIPEPGDYDGDGKTDIALFRKSTGEWMIINSSTGQYRTQWWGYSTLGDTPVPGDYDGDGKTDLAVFRKSTGYWLIINSSTGQYSSTWWGYTSAGDVPVAGDYDGDGKTDLAVFRKSTGDWLIINSSSGQYRSLWWGYDSLGDLPIPNLYIR